MGERTDMQGTRETRSSPVGDDVEGLAQDIQSAREAQAGDSDAFARLYVGYAPMVHAIILARTPARDADDLVQDVFALAWSRLSELRDGAAFGGWIASIARRRAIDSHRRRRPTEPFGVRHGGATTFAAAEALSFLAVIQTLPVAYREPLLMRFVEGMTGPEIAMRTGMTAGSVRVNLHRGVKLLRQKLGTSEGSQDDE
ncbi:MAG: sigma-70 family RNA polymerase sigma factor [Nannocystaceae bacterium]|nr:sigma-70 family RNA polymerase sigma factor [Nannocystaceae bacterium]